MAEKQFTSTLKFVDKVVKVMSNEDDKKRISHLVESIRNADGLEIDKADEERRIALLNLNALALAQQAVCLAFIARDLTESLENEFRELPNIDEVREAARAAEESVKSEEKEISEKVNAFRERGKKYDLMRVVCSGKSPKEAKAAQDEYEKQLAQMRG